MTNPMAMTLKEFEGEVGPIPPEMQQLIGRTLINHPGVETLGEFIACSIADAEESLATLRALADEFREDAA